MKNSTSGAFITSVVAAIALIVNSDIKEAGAQLVFMLAFGGIVFIPAYTLYSCISFDWILSIPRRIKPPQINLSVTKRQFVSILYFVVLLVMVLFPPHFRIGKSGNNFQMGHYFLFNEINYLQIDISRLAIYILTTTIAFALIFIAITIKERTYYK